jgi:DNA-binding NtrC family response regulator
VIEHVAVLADAGRPLLPADIPVGEDVVVTSASQTATGIPAGLLDQSFHPAKDRLVALFEKEYLGRLVVRAGGNMSKAARLAGVDRTTLYRLMEKHSMQRDDVAAAAFR